MLVMAAGRAVGDVKVILDCSVRLSSCETAGGFLTERISASRAATDNDKSAAWLKENKDKWRYFVRDKLKTTQESGRQLSMWSRRSMCHVLSHALSTTIDPLSPSTGLRVLLPFNCNKHGSQSLHSHREIRVISADAGLTLRMHLHDTTRQTRRSVANKWREWLLLSHKDSSSYITNVRHKYSLIVLNCSSIQN